MNYYFITGSSSGIGYALANILLENKNNFVYGFSRTNTILHDRFEHYSLDLSNLEKVSNYKFPVLTNVDRVILINNAGTLGTIKHYGNLKAKEIISSFNVNITSVAILSNSFINSYQNIDKEKVIINISSGAANSAYDGWASYCATKSAINMLTEVIFKEQEKKQFPIKIFAIAPGVVDTSMQDLIRKTDKINFSNIEKFKMLKASNSLYKAKDVAYKLVSYIKNIETIPSLISRIEL